MIKTHQELKKELIKSINKSCTDAFSHLIADTNDNSKKSSCCLRVRGHLLGS